MNNAIIIGVAAYLLYHFSRPQQPAATGPATVANRTPQAGIVAAREPFAGGGGSYDSIGGGGRQLREYSPGRPGGDPFDTPFFNGTGWWGGGGPSYRSQYPGPPGVIDAGGVRWRDELTDDPFRTDGGGNTA